MSRPLQPQSELPQDPAGPALIQPRSDRADAVPHHGAVQGAPADSADSNMAEIRRRILPQLTGRIDPDAVIAMPRRELARRISELVAEVLDTERLGLDLPQQGELARMLLDDLAERSRRPDPEPAAPPNGARPEPSAAARPESTGGAQSSDRSLIEKIKRQVHPVLMDRIDLAVASQLPQAELAQQIAQLLGEILVEQKVQLNSREQKALSSALLHDMLGLGPLEPLLGDVTITDILVNGPNQVYIERAGRLVLTDVKFRDDAHVMNVATRIVTRIGRRIDESTPLVDARLADGSRVNVIVPPLAIDGPSISIRKFAERKITLDVMERQHNLSPELAEVLRIAARCRLNILISGGTGSGKTTLLNAISQMIDHDERVVTIEDAAELQLQQPHTVRLETRPPNLEGQGQIMIRDLVRNSLRMRPDRIIVGEVRGGEVLDMLQAMNTGHDGSMSTIHANSPRDALTRLENMVAMSGINLPSTAVKTQIADAIDMIVQISRMRDGVRRVVRVIELVGMEGEVITTQDLFTYEYRGESDDGTLLGDFKASGLRPHFMPRAEYYGQDGKLKEVMSCGATPTSAS